MFQNESVVETKICPHCSISFSITDKDMEFYEKVSPVFPLEKGGRSEATGGLVVEVKYWEERGLIWSNPPNPLSQGGEFHSFRPTSREGVKIEWNKVRYLIPTPTLCPDCRQQRRLSFRNERKLYHRKCDLTGKQIISIYSPDKPHTVYDQKEWWGDSWNPLDYGRDFDFSRSFFEQFGELMREVPKLALVVFDNENSPYTNFTANCRNIYMCHDILDSEDVYFSSTVKSSADCINCTDIENARNCYWCISSSDTSNCHYALYSTNCHSSEYLFDCQNVSNSLFCIWLRNKEFHVLNKPVSRERFMEIKQELLDGQKLQKWKIQYAGLLNNFPRRNLDNLGSEDCRGNNLLNSRYATDCFDSVNIENCKYSVVAHSMQNCMDTTIHNPECFYDYEAVSGGKLKMSAFNALCWNASGLYYSIDCFDVTDCFGCTGLRANAQYCILNKQYTKEEYEALVPRIIKHMSLTPNPSPFGGEGGMEWGEFFPSSLSPFGYTETVAMEYYPLTRNQISEGRDQNGKNMFNWSDYEKQNGYEGIFYEPLNISEYDSSVVWEERANANKEALLKGILKCEISEKPYRIIAQELEFYIKHHLPIPRRHPDQRHLDRMALRNPRKLFERKCDKCGKDMITTYSPERPEKVYCETCYEKEVIG